MAGTVRGNNNRFLTPDIIAREALFRLMDALVIPRLANRTFEKYFSGKIGNRITIKKPYKAKVQSGRVMSTIAKMVDRTLDVMVDKRFHFGLKYNDEEKTLDIVDFGQRYLQTGVEEIAYQYDIEGAEELGYNLAYSDGTPGSGLTTKRALDVSAHARHVAIPQNSMNYALLDPVDFANISDDVKENVFTPGDNMVATSIRRRYRGMLAGWHLFESVHIPHMTVANPGTPQIAGSDQHGSTLNLEGLTANSRVFNKGQMITINGVYEVQPRGDRRSTGRLMTFTIMEDVTTPASTTTASVKISPELNAGQLTTTDADGTSITLDAFQNVSARPANDATVNLVGTAGNTYRQGLFYEKSALEYINIQLEQFESALLKGRATDEQTGLSLSLTGWFDGAQQEETQRIDAMFGVKCVYPELGIRFVGNTV